MDLTVMQVALFFEDIIRKPERKIKPLICNVFGEDYVDKADKELLNVNLPIDFPTIQMVYTKKFRWNINISQSRLDVFAELPVQVNEDFQSELIQESKATIKKVVHQIVSQIDVNRVGVVGKFFEINETPTLSISQKLFDGKYNKSTELNFRVNNITEYDDHIINNIIQVGEATVSTFNKETSETIPYRGVLLMRDINNSAAEGESLEEEKINKIIDFACGNFEREKIVEVWG